MKVSRQEIRNPALSNRTFNPPRTGIMDSSTLFRNSLEMDVEAFRVLSRDMNIPTLYPVRHPRSGPREGLVGLSAPLAILQKNFDSFRAGFSPVSTLVHGFRGTGKTSMVLEAWRQLNRSHAPRGIPRCRLIQVDRDGIPHLLPLIDSLADRKDFFSPVFRRSLLPRRRPELPSVPGVSGRGDRHASRKHGPGRHIQSPSPGFRIVFQTGRRPEPRRNKR